MNELTHLRNKIDEIDEKIFHLIKERSKISLKIGRIKDRLKVPIKDFSREQEVFNKIIKLSKKLRLPEQEMITIVKNIMEIAIFGQEQKRIKKYPKIDKQKKVLIIGGSGRLGSWLSNYFHDLDHEIIILDKVKPKEDFFYINKLPLNLKEFNVIVIATPIRVSLNILQSLLAYDLSNTLVFDVASVKGPLEKILIMLKNSGAMVTSIHPMFGPKSKILFGKHIIRCSLGVKGADEEVYKLFEPTALTMVDLSFNEHDRLMSYLLSLSHLLNILFLKVIRKNKISLLELEKYSSTTFIDQLKIAKNVDNENPNLYYEIQNLNSFNKRLYKDIKICLQNLIDSIINNGEKSFASNFKGVK